jgi:protease-4
LKKIGVSTDSAQIGANAAMFSPTTDFSDQAHRRLEAFLDETYRGFKDHVATGRHMTPEEVEAVAKGRVWSGEDAKSHGLVDELGGYSVALRLAREAASLPPDAPFTLTVFPREETLPELLYNRLSGKDREREDGSVTSSSIERSLRAARPLLQRLEMLLDAPGVLMMAPIGLR